MQTADGGTVRIGVQQVPAQLPQTGGGGDCEVFRGTLRSMSYELKLVMKLGNSEYNLFLCKKYMFMKTTSEYLQLLKQFKDTNAKKYGIQKIGLFGSVARGEHQEGSDVDVCFEGVPKGFFAIGGIKIELEQLFGCSVDVVRLREKMDSFFKEQVMKEVIYV